MNKVLGIHLTHPDCAMPTYGTKGAACFDLRYQPYGKQIIQGYSEKNEPYSIHLKEPFGDIIIHPKCRVLLPSGIIFAIPQDHSIRIHIRSSLAFKLGIGLANSEAVIDSDYFHESFILAHNMSDVPVTIRAGERIAQAELVPHYRDYEIMELVEAPAQTTDRIGGVGSTGKT
jgi:dUTP pyrophosphatase